jgi:hypothetical protein
VKVKNDNLKRYQRQLKQMAGMKVGIGCVGDHGDGLSNSDLMLIHEFGTSDKKVPARMPIRATFRDDGNITLIKKTLEHAQQHFFDEDKGFNLQAIGEAVGNTMKELVKAQIRRRLSPPLAESTLEQKQRRGQSSIPLYATGTLLNSVEFQVTK